MLVVQLLLLLVCVCVCELLFYGASTAKVISAMMQERKEITRCMQLGEVWISLCRHILE